MSSRRRLGGPHGFRTAEFDTALICEQGHVMTSKASFTDVGANHCRRCGAALTGACSSCSRPIRGNPTNVAGGYRRPSYCEGCGSPYPWTEAALEAGRELFEELDELTDDDRRQLNESLPALIAEGPRTELAETRFKKILKRAGPVASDAVIGVLRNVAAEAVKGRLGI